jgi:hypothetical protein
MCQPREKETLSDYDRSIIKSYYKKGNHRYNNIPQLGEQPQQFIPPLQVLSKEDEATADFVVEMKLTKAQLRGKKKTICMRGTSYVARVAADATNENAIVA